MSEGISRRSLFAALPMLQQQPQRNVLLIISDDLNTQLRCYGSSWMQTPNIDKLASRGVLFEHAYCQYPLCQPSRASFLSGLRPETTKVWTLDTPTREHLGNHVMLPEYFRKHGYYTAHAGKVFHTGDHAEDPRSWDEEQRENGKNPPKDQVLQSGDPKGPKGHSFRWFSLRSTDEETPDGQVARNAVAMMEKAKRANKPFFIGAGFRRPHAPYAAPSKYFDLYPLDKVPLPAASLSHFAKLLPAAVNHDPPDQPLSEATVRECLRAYFASVSFMDAQVGVLMEGLSRLNLWENTVVIFLGDNGYHTGDHDGLWHKNSLFEEGARIPLIVYALGRKGNASKSSRLVELVDLYPTLTELCALATPSGLEGTSLSPLLDSPQRAWKRAAFTMQGRGKERTEAAKDIVFLGKSVRTERWRYTEWDEGRQGVELYDHSADPMEMSNVAEKKELKPTRLELQSLLRGGWKAALP